MKKMKVVTTMLVFVLLSGVKTTFAQDTDKKKDSIAVNKISDREVVNDAWEHDWQKMNGEERKSFRNKLENNKKINDDDLRQAYIEERQKEWDNMSKRDQKKYVEDIRSIYKNDEGLNDPVYRYYSRQ